MPVCAQAQVIRIRVSCGADCKGIGVSGVMTRHNNRRRTGTSDAQQLASQAARVLGGKWRGHRIWRWSVPENAGVEARWCNAPEPDFAGAARSAAADWGGGRMTQQGRALSLADTRSGRLPTASGTSLPVSRMIRRQEFFGSARLSVSGREPKVIRILGIFRTPAVRRAAVW